MTTEVYVLVRASYEDNDTIYPDWPDVFASRDGAEAALDAWLADYGPLRDVPGVSYDIVARWSADLYRCPIDGGETRFVWHREGDVPEAWIDAVEAEWERECAARKEATTG